MSFKIIHRFFKKHTLTKNNLISAYYRFFKWQIISRVRTKPFAYPFIENAQLFVKKGMTGATGNIYAGLHEFYDMGFLLHVLRDKDMFADVGANIGSYTILASGVVGAKSVAFEPVPSTYNFLQKNIELNNLQPIAKAYNVGVGNEKGILKFTKDSDTTNHIVLEDADNASTINVEIITLDDFFLNNQIPSLMKVDVEGFEKSVFDGGKNVLANTQLKALIVELNGCCHRYGVDEKDIHQILINNHFKTYHYNPLERELIETPTYNTEENTIYVKDIEWVKNRISNSRKYKVLGKLI
jgi:FkbM family methyltransferase